MRPSKILVLVIIRYQTGIELENLFAEINYCDPLFRIYTIKGKFDVNFHIVCDQPLPGLHVYHSCTWTEPKCSSARYTRYRCNQARSKDLLKEIF